jgi:pimeloyl-ACP methyl ester carboxylesterase
MHRSLSLTCSHKFSTGIASGHGRSYPVSYTVQTTRLNGTTGVSFSRIATGLYFTAEDNDLQPPSRRRQIWLMNTMTGEASMSATGSYSQDSLTYQLPCGCQVGYAVYGVPLPNTTTVVNKTSSNRFTLPQTVKDATPTILYCHGVPGSRLEAAPLHKHGLKLGVRIISIDRPGIGLSSPLSISCCNTSLPRGRRQRQILDFPLDAQSLLSYLRIDQYFILGYSGGAPYALACALASPQQSILGIGIVAGLAPWHITAPTLTLCQRLMMNLAYYTPSLMRYLLEKNIAYYARQEESTFQALVKGQIESFGINARAIYKDDSTRHDFVRNLREAYSSNVDIIVKEISLLVDDWEFTLTDVAEALRRPDTDLTPDLKIWYGSEDVNVPLKQGEGMYAEFTSAAKSDRQVSSFTVYPENCHFSIMHQQGEQMLSELISRQ